MTTRTEINGNIVTAFLSGEIDHHNAPAIRETIDECVVNRRPERLILDFGDVTFMDSSGIGLVMGRYRLIEDMDCKLEIINLSPNSYKVMKLAGLEKLAQIKRKPMEEKSDEMC